MENHKNVSRVSNKLLVCLIFCGVFLFPALDAFSTSQNNETDPEIRVVRGATCQNANKKTKQMSKICSGICQDDGNYCEVGDGLIKGPGKKLSCQCNSGSQDPTSNEKYSCEPSLQNARNKQKKRVSNFCRKTCSSLESADSTFEPYTCKSKGKGAKDFYCVCFSSSSNSGSGGDDSAPCVFGFEDSCFATDSTSNPSPNPVDSDSTENSIPPLIPIGSGDTEIPTSTSDPTLDVTMPTDSSDLMPTIAPAPMLPPGSAGTENGITGAGSPGNNIVVSQGVGDVIQSANIPIQDEPLDQPTET